MLQWNFYQPSDVEKMVIALYETLDINTPIEIDQEVIAPRLGIDVHYRNGIVPFSIYDGQKMHIGLDSSLSPMQQRLDFFHELGHLLRGHAGDQTTLPQLFSSLQEEQAKYFATYALMPYTMIKELPTPEYERDIPHLIATEFRVPMENAKERWGQIQKRISTGRWEQACIERERYRYRKSNPANWCDQAKEMFRRAVDGKLQKGQGVIIR